MEISAECIGIQTRPFKTRVTSRQSMNYAAAIHDANPRYLDDTQTEGIVAPPMIVPALTWPISLNIGDYLESESFPAACTKQQVHHTECISWHAPIKPGQTLDIRGELIALLSHPAGCEMVMQYDAYDGDTLIFTEYSGALLRGVTLAGEEGGRDRLPEIPKATVVDDPAWCERIAIDPLAAHVYDGCSAISFPIHTSPAFAQSVGLPGIILQGTATLAYAVKTIINRERAGDSSGIQMVECIFTGMVVPGASIEVRLLCRDKAGAYCFEVVNHDGQRAISRGRLVFQDPGTA